MEVLAAFAALVVVSALAHPASAQDGPFLSMQLDHGISLEVPSHWSVLPIEGRQNLAAASRSVVDNAGVGNPGTRNVTLLAMKATPEPTGAMILVEAMFPAAFTQSDLAAATPSDLEWIGSEFLSVFEKANAASGGVLKVVRVDPVRIEQINGHGALVIPYIRDSVVDDSQWRVTQYQIPVTGHTITVTLSHRVSDEFMWKPILEKVKRSIAF